jgi:hypothetical protein
MLAKRWWIGCLAASLLLALGTGCNSERDKGINRGKDRPEPPAVAATPTIKGE